MMVYLREMDILDRFSATIYKADNFCYFLLKFLHTKVLLKKGHTLKGKNLRRKLLPFKEQMVSFKSTALFWK